jgi:oligosaccharyltransferase complex subunit alpha (ribophorin I)
LKESLKPQDSVKLQIKMALVNQLKPFPKEIKQSDSQKVVYEDYIVYLSVYRVSLQTTTVSVGTTLVDSYSKKEPSTIRGQTLVYGPYSGQSPKTQIPMRIHFLNNKRLMSITSLTKILEVSHWGVLSIEEHYELRNVGPTMKEGFSRLDYSRSGNNAPSSFNLIVAKLPLNAHDIYYRDRIGNISTSTSKRSKDGKNLEFEITPRFPIFGGWKTKFYFGYNLPIKEVLSNEGSNFILRSIFGTPFDETVVESMTLKIILPEGSKNVEISLPFEYDEELHEIEKTYLDTTGRTVIVIKKRNVVDEHSKEFSVTYNFSILDQYRKPMVVIGLLFLFCLSLMIYVRIDLTISKDANRIKQEKKEKAQEIVEKYIDQQLLRSNYYIDIQYAIQSKDKEKMSSAFSMVEEERRKIDEIVSNYLTDLKDSEFSRQVFEVESKEKKKFEITKKLSQLANDQSKDVKKKMEALEEEYDKLSSEMIDTLEFLKE